MGGGVPLYPNSFATLDLLYITLVTRAQLLRYAHSKPTEFPSLATSGRFTLCLSVIKISGHASRKRRCHQSVDQTTDYPQLLDHESCPSRIMIVHICNPGNRWGYARRERAVRHTPAFTKQTWCVRQSNSDWAAEAVNTLSFLIRFILHSMVHSDTPTSKVLDFLVFFLP